MTLCSYHQAGLRPFNGLEKPLGGLALEEGGFGGEWEVMLAVMRLRLQVLRCRLSINGPISFEQGFQGRAWRV